MQTADRLRADCELLFLGFENNGIILLSRTHFRFAW